MRRAERRAGRGCKGLPDYLRNTTCGNSVSVRGVSAERCEYRSIQNVQVEAVEAVRES